MMSPHERLYRDGLSRKEEKRKLQVRRKAFDEERSIAIHRFQLLTASQ
jgi:hypothetical protein